MKQVIVGVFAHPDDEAFGPSGSLHLHHLQGDDVYLICATSGEAGEGSPDIRSRELEDSARILGVKELFQLDFQDGRLCNNDIPALSAKIEKVLEQIQTRQGEGCELSFITFEQSGVTGHIDHIVASLATTYVYTHSDSWLKPDAMLGKLKYFCVCDSQKQEDLDYFVYSPEGHPEEEVDETVDVSSVLEVKKQAIRAHHSQQDYKRALALGDRLLSNEHFIYYKHRG